MIVRDYDARQVFGSADDAENAAATAERVDQEPGGGLLFNLVHQGGGAHYVVCRRRVSRDLVGYLVDQAGDE